MTDRTVIPRIDAQALIDSDHSDHGTAMEAARRGATDVGFITIHNATIGAEEVARVLRAYAAFFALPPEAKRAVDMSRTGSNRGWGAPGSEQVDPDANADYKQFFDAGLELAPDDPLHRLEMPSYAPNQWPAAPEGFADTLRDYYRRACALSLDLLSAITQAAIGEGDYFRSCFERPMALLRGNHYPARPEWATERDFGIATHTDYGCLTLLATDGTPGLEVRRRGGGWNPVSAPVGEFVINFGEMLQLWTGGRIVATPHRVVGTGAARMSVPLFFNPQHDTNIAPLGSGERLLAVDHLQARFDETYVHLRKV